MATIKDVAKKAGTSIATVSNYLNKTKPVGKKRTQNIRKAIEELNYIPNLSAKSLKSNQYNDIGVILPNFDDSYYVQIFQGIDLAFQNTDYYLNLAFTYDIPELEIKIVDGFVKKQIRGLIMITCQPDKWEYYYKQFYSVNKSIVLIDRQINNLDVNFVSFDYYTAVKNITLHLLQQSYRDIYLFTGPAIFHCESECVNGFTQAFADLSLSVDNSHIIQTLLNKEDAFRNTLVLLKKHTPEIIVTTSESCSKGVIEGLILLGKTLQDIPIITLGEDHWNRFTHSCASHSVTRPAINIGSQAARIMMEQIKSPKTYESKSVVMEGSDNNRAIQVTRTANKNIKTKIGRTKIRVLLLETAQSSALLGLLPNFENETGVRVEYKMLPNQYYINHILEEHADDEQNRPDVYMFDIPWLYHLASSGVLADISRFIQNPNFDKSIYFDNCLKYFSEYNGNYYGLPFMYAPQILYYRKDLFTNPKISAEYEKLYHLKLRNPQTWTEFNAIAEYFTVYCSAIEYGTSIPASYSEYLMPEIYMRLWSYGGNIISDNKVVFDSPKTLKAFTNLKNTFKYAKPDYMQANDISIVEAFLRGDTAMLISFPSFLADIIDLRASGMKGNISYEHIPGKTPCLGGWSMGVSGRSKQKKDAFSFVQWACTKQIGNYLPLLGGYPAIQNVYTNDELIQLYPWLPLCLSAYKYTKPIIPPVLGSKAAVPQSELEYIICKWFYEVLEDKIKITTAITNAHKELEQLLKSQGITTAKKF
ncbi:MAG: extracellular solute-binding protein [Treponema sp.]|jgi:multiple sugar transport system substrate-binding protein|nr:extracellular solute-binding protein [Treponema sp.]